MSRVRDFLAIAVSYPSFGAKINSLIGMRILSHDIVATGLFCSKALNSTPVK